MQLLTGVTVVLGVVTTTVMADGYQTSTQDTHDYLVKFRSEYSEEDFQSFFHQLTRYCEAYDCSARVKQRFHRLLDGGVLTLSSEDHLQQWIQERVEVDKFEADSTISLVFEDVNNVTTESTEYWNLDRIDQRQSELDGFYSYTFNGEGINAYIIDSGIRLTHHEFDRERTRLVDFIDDGNDDCNGHGTHVAGTVGGRTVGVAKGVNLVAVRVFPCEGETTLSILLNGLVWTFEDFLDSGASTAVINLSLSSSASPFLDDVIDVLNDTGLVVISAAGNSDADDYILVTGQDQNAEGEFELFVQMSESGEAQFPGDGEASYPTATPSVSPTNTQGETWTASSTSSSPPGRSPGASYSSSRSPTPTASASDRPAPWVEYGPKLDSLESFITITFNTATNRGNVGVTFECLNLLYSDIGEDATLFSECYWTSSRELVIELRSPELDFQQLGKTITAGSKITLIGGLIKQDILSAALPQTTLTVTSPDRSPIVNFEVSHSHVITLCGNIEANVNFATGGSRVRGIEWTWVMKSVHLLNGANITYSNVTRPLRNEIARATRENRDSIFVPQERVPKGITYKLALKGENMFGSSKVREIEFKVERQSAPSITFEEEPSGQIRSSQGALFRASASLKTCEISDVKNPLEFSFKYAWHLLGPNGTFLDVSAFLTRDPRRLVIPAYSLFPSDSSYSVVFRVTAESAQRVLKSSRTIELRVVPSRVVATIAGGTRAIDIFSDLALDASNSGSPEENLPTLPSDWKVGKEYLWTCETKMINCTNFLIGNDSGREMLHVFRRRLQTLKQKVSIDEDLPVLFTVTISLQLSRSGTPTFYSTDSQSVTIIISGTAIPTVVREDFFPGEMPEAVIGGKPHFIVNPGSEVRVTADVKESQETESQWILVDEDPLTLNDIIDSPSVASPLLVVRPNQFFVGNRYTLQYRSQFTSNLAPTASFGFTEIRLSVNRPPRGGRLLIKPFLDITSDVDDVLLEATGWKDEDTPLLYSFYVGFDKNIEYSRTLRWAQENPTVVTKLPTPPNGHKIWIFLEVQDALGASEVYSSSVSVNHPSVEQLENFVVSKREKARECRITKDANCAARAVRDAIRAQNQEILKGDI
eukprot:gb/GECG01003157.1/.p1 GENE.gb/GECG01003157.1/~~gb/GECG01003157.1/.p1  ORF type:complete len:1105 (+),score=125.46 gb/GECG01003157.1/:1-3315(+)